MGSSRVRDNLRSRLSQLRAQAAPLPGRSAREAADSPQRMRERLKRFAPRKGASVSAEPRLAGDELAGLLGGRYIPDGLIVIERNLSFDTYHGERLIGEGLEESLAFFGHDDGSVVFMDTETTGLAGGTGTVIFLLGLGRVTGAELHVVQYLLTKFSGEAALLSHGEKFIRGARTFVTYNGKSFDHPLLMSRYRLAGLADPFGPLRHIDLLHPTRRAFRNHWANCTLRTAEERLLGFRRVDDLPGSEAPQTWFDWVRYGETKNMPRVIQHNGLDILSLAVLIPALRDAFENPGAREMNLRAIARHFERQSDEAAAYEYLLANRTHLNPDAALELARLSRRREDWELAVDIWYELAAFDHVEAIERLAKYHEHVARNVPVALTFTHQLLRLERDEQKHQRRESRLLAKLRRLNYGRAP